MIEWRKTVQEYPCETCGSPPGVQCITIGGNHTLTPHAARSRRASQNLWRDPAAEEGSSVGHSPVQTPRQEDRYASSSE